MAINLPGWRPKQTSGLEKLAAAVDIAKGIYGISVDTKELDIKRQQVENEKAVMGAESEKRGLEIDKLKRDASGDDPNSSESVLYRDMVVQRGGKNVPNNLTANQAKTVYEDILKPKPKKEKDPIAEELAQARLDEARRKKEEGTKISPDQSKAAVFATRMAQAEDVFQKLADNGDSGTDAGTSIQRSSLYPAVLESKVFKQRNQAERNFLNAVLRRESGAAISPSEFTSGEQQYFSRIGDPPEVIAQKTENRRIAREGIAAEATEKAMNKIPKGPGSDSADHSLDDLLAEKAKRRNATAKK